MPNPPLVLIDGRRMAEYPQPYNSTDNFVNVSAIPSRLSVSHCSPKCRQNAHWRYRLRSCSSQKNPWRCLRGRFV